MNSEDEIRSMFGIPPICDCWRRLWYAPNIKCDASPNTIQKSFADDRRDCYICVTGYATIPHLSRRRWGGSVYPRDLRIVCDNCHTRFEKPWYIRMLQDDMGNVTLAAPIKWMGSIIFGLFISR